MALAHEIAVDKDFSLQKIQPANEVEKQVNRLYYMWDEHSLVDLEIMQTSLGARAVMYCSLNMFTHVIIS